jgi:ribosomal protein S18 acetylase RimI-like enzyme
VPDPNAHELTYVDRPSLDQALLARLLYVSYFDWLPPDAPRPAFDDFLRDEPAVPRWTAGWGRPGDAAVAALDGDRTVGLAWCRLLRADDAGNSFVSEDIPCLAIAVEADARGRGIGGALLDRLLRLLRESGQRALTLAVEQDNPARRLYPRHGFVPEAEVAGYIRMRASLDR